VFWGFCSEENALSFEKVPSQQVWSHWLIQYPEFEKYSFSLTENSFFSMGKA